MLSNPVVLRMGVVLFVMGFAFWLATLLLRRMRRALTEESFAIDSAPELEQVSGRYFASGKPRRSSRRSYDQAAAARLWQVSADLGQRG